MPHLDDGILHAWLDGALEALAAADALPDGMQAADVVAHLEHCADCRGRLEMERQTRERAGLVLRDAAPARLETPPFRAAGAASSRPRRRTVLPYAWAASLLLAAGAGWWGSQISRDPRAAAPSVRTMESEAAPDAIELPPPPEAGTGGSPELPDRAAEERAGRSVAAPAALPSGATERRREDISELPPPPPPVERAADAGAVREASRQPPPAASVAPLAETAFAPMQLEAASPAALAAALQFLARDSAGLVDWHRVAADEEQQIDSIAFTLARADIVARDFARDLGVRAVRVTQRLPEGEEVEVVTWRLEPRPAAAEKAASGELTLLREPGALPGARQETVFAVGGEDVVVVVRAPLRLGAQHLAERLGIRP
jgi:hypothetical protein